jgi:phosphatidate cytidylyltransferase
VSPLVNRIVIGVPLAVGTLAALWVGGAPLALVGMAFAVLGLDELYRMGRRYRPMVIAGHAGGLGIVAGAHWGGIEWLLLPIPLTLVATFLLMAIVGGRESATASIAVTMLGPCWIALGIGFLVLLRTAGPDDEYGLNLVLATLLGVWASDIFAYFGGRAYGRRRLAPAISPGKTVEGFLTGLVLGTAVVWFTLYGQGVGQGEALVVGVVVCLASPLGDLFESFLKRDLGVKDSGRTLGAHGGVLDRIDALLFAGPAAYVTLYLLGAV